MGAYVGCPHSRQHTTSHLDLGLPAPRMVRMNACCFKQRSLWHFAVTAPDSPSRQTRERRGLDTSLSSQTLTRLLSAGVASCPLLHLFQALSFRSHLIQPQLQAANGTEGQTSSIVKWDLASILPEHSFLRSPTRRPLPISARHISEG